MEIQEAKQIKTREGVTVGIVEQTYGFQLSLHNAGTNVPVVFSLNFYEAQAVQKILRNSLKRREQPYG